MIEQVLRMIHLKQRSDLHLARKIWHMTGVSIIAALYAFLPNSLSLILLTVTTITAIALDVVRLRNAKVNEVVVALLGPVMRKSEVDKLAGTTYLFAGVTIIAFLFPHQIVLLTILFLAFADPIASYFGIKFGKDKIFGNKSLQGTMAAFIACAVLTYTFLSTHWLMMDRIYLVSILGGLVGALAELIPIGKLDDNFSLPVLSASALWILFKLFGAFAVMAPIS